MKLDPRIKSFAKQSGQKDMQDDIQEKQQGSQPHIGSGKRNRGTLFGGLPRVCRGVQNMLPAFIDESLNAGGRQTVGRHLAVCAACRSELRLLARSEQALIGAASAVPMPGDLRAGFYARLATTPRRADKRRVFVPALAVCGLLLIASITAYRLSITPRSSMAQSGPVSYDARSIAADFALAPHPLTRRQFARVVGLPDSLAHNRASHPASAPAYQGEKQSSVLVMQRTPPVGGAAHQSLASKLTDHKAEVTVGRRGRHNEQRPLRIAAVPRPAFLQRLLAGAGSKRKKNSNMSGRHNIQVALLTQSERNASSPQTRHDVSLIRGESSPSTDSFGLRIETADINAVQLAKDQHNGLAYRYENSQQMSLSTTLDGEAARKSMTDAREDGAMEYNAEGIDGVSFQVKDAQRGFTSGTRSESRMQVRGGRQVLSVHLEDQDKPEPDTAEPLVPIRPAAQPAQATRTGSDKAGSDKER